MMISLPDDLNLIEVVKKVYELSKPQGRGMFHYQPGPLTDKEAEILISLPNPDHIVLSLDYVKGRSCKFTIFKEEDGNYIDDSWYDHTDEQFKELLKTIGIDSPIKSKHGCSCNCDDCQRKRS